MKHFLFSFIFYFFFHTAYNREEGASVVDDDKDLKGL
jgi:hypothetical protein